MQEIGRVNEHLAQLEGRLLALLRARKRRRKKGELLGSPRRGTLPDFPAGILSGDPVIAGWSGVQGELVGAGGARVGHGPGG